MKKVDDTITNESRKVKDKRFAQFRANKLFVIMIINKSNFETIKSIENSVYNNKITYNVNKIINADKFNTNINDVYSNGIHYFRSIEPCICHDDNIPNNYMFNIITYTYDGVPYYETINVFDVHAKNGHNDILMLIKNKFPEIKGTKHAFDCAAMNGHNETLLLLKNKFTEIKGTSIAFDWAAENGHNDTLLLLKNEFSYIKGTSYAVDWVAGNGSSSALPPPTSRFAPCHNDTLLLLKKEFPEIKGTSYAFDWASESDHYGTILLLKKEFPEIKHL